MQQSSYRAELRALVYAVETADVPMTIVIDNESVANIARKWAQQVGSGECPAEMLRESEDLWQRVWQAMSNRDPVFFSCLLG